MYNCTIFINRAFISWPHLSVLSVEVIRKTGFTIVLLVAVLTVVSKHPGKVVSLKVIEYLDFSLDTFRTNIAFEFLFSIDILLGDVG